MSLKPSLIKAAPSETIRVARTAFSRGNIYISIVRRNTASSYSDRHVAIVAGSHEPVEVDWNNRQAICPAGKQSISSVERQLKKCNMDRVVNVKFRRRDFLSCDNRARCVRSDIGAPR